MLLKDYLTLTSKDTEFKQFVEENGYFEQSVEENDVAQSSVLGLENTRVRSVKSELGNLSVELKRNAESSNKDMGAPLYENERLELKSVSDSETVRGALLENGFKESDISDLFFVAIPSDFLVMGKAKWVISKYTTNKSSFSEITVYNQVDRETNVIGWGFNLMEHDRGSKIVIGGKWGFKTYVAPFRLLELLREHNTLSNQVFNGYLLGLSETEKGALKSDENSHFRHALRQNAFSVVLDKENTDTESLESDFKDKLVFKHETQHNAWAFRALDGYQFSNKEYWSKETELDLMELQELFYEVLENVDWRFKAETIARAVVRDLDKELSSFVNFYNGESVIDAITELSVDKQRFEDVQSELIKLARYYWANESEEDNSFSIDETIDDYDSKPKTDYSQSRGYKKAYLESELRENAIARGVITEYIYSNHYTRSLDCYYLELERNAIRESSVAHNKELEQRFSENKTEQRFWDRMEKELGVSGLTAFTPASFLPNNECEWASRSDEHFAYFLDSLRSKQW